MDYVTMSIDENIAIVSISNCKQVSKQTISSQTSHKVQLSFFKVCIEIAVVECLKTVFWINILLTFPHLLLQRIKRYRVINKFNHSGIA